MSCFMASGRTYRPTSGRADLCEREADRPACLALQRPVHGARVMYEVRPRPRIAQEEFRGQHVGLEAIARGTGDDDVAGRMGTALGERMNMIERGTRVVERRGAVHAAAAAVA